jgi:group I intron endonuclease
MQLYKISFSTTPKVYIGISKRSAKLRFQAHCNKNVKIKSLIHKAIQKYGNPILTILGEFDNWELLCLAEQEAIEKFNSRVPNGYNITIGGEGAVGVVHTKETKEKWRLAKIGKKQSHEHAAKSATARAGQKNSPEHIEKYISHKRKPVINSSGEIFKSAMEASRVLSARLGVNAMQSNISACANGKRNNAYGLTWSYDVSKIPAFKKTNLSEKSVLLVEKGIKFESVQDAKKWIAEQRGSANNQRISYAAREEKTAYGFHWKYV